MTLGEQSTSPGVMIGVTSELGEDGLVVFDALHAVGNLEPGGSRTSECTCRDLSLIEVIEVHLGELVDS